MKIQHYFTLLVLATVITLITAAEWTQSKKSAAEQREAFYSNLTQQTSNLEQQLKSRVENLRYQLAQAASRHTDQTSSLSSDSSFSAIAWLRKNPEGSASKYKAIWAEANTQTFDPTWLKGLNFSQVKDGETLFVRRLDRNGNAFFALVMTAVSQTTDAASELPEEASTNVDDRIYLFGALAPAALSAWVDEWVGSSRSAMVFDEYGNVVAHSQRQYSGTNLKADKFVNASMRSGRTKLTTEFADLESEERIGESVRVGQTNLRAAVSIPKAHLLRSGKNEQGSQRSLMIVVGLLLVGLTHLFGGRLASKFARSAIGSPTSEFQFNQQTNQTPEEPNVQVFDSASLPEPEITFEEVEQKTRVNLNDILTRSAEIRKRLEIDFVESVESEQKAFFDELAASTDVESKNSTDENRTVSLDASITPRVKVRRPKVSL